MPQLKRNESKVQRVFLPSTKIGDDGKPLPQDQWVWVDFDTRKDQVADVLEQEVDENASALRYGVNSVLRRVKGWNVTDASNAALPLTDENLQLIDQDDFSYLTSLITQSKKGLTDSEKKS